MRLACNPGPLLAAVFCLAAGPAAGDDGPYVIEPVPVPDGVVLEVGALELLPDGRLAVGTRRGEVWLVTGAGGDDPDQVAFDLHASGLHEILGLAWREDGLYLTQRPELTRLRDLNGDGRADAFDTVSDFWHINGDYHEYAFGSRFTPDGEIWVTLCLTGSFNSHVPFRGWAARIDPDKGTTTPVAHGIRSPGGMGINAAGDVFYCDNQGPWNGSSALKHLQPGSFQGHPAGNRWFEITDALGERPPDPESGSRIEDQRRRIPNFVPPAVVLPHGKLGQSPTGIVCDLTDGAFGPFKEQLFVAEQTHSQVQRVFLEQVNGVYQGAAFPFLSGFASGNTAVALGADGVLYVGGSDRGWGARGGRRWNLERVRWDGGTPFEVLEMRVRPDGFELVFTEPVERDSAADAASYHMEAYTYIYRSEYGSPEVDQVEPGLEVLEVSDDGRRVVLKVEPMTRGHVHDLRLPGIRAAGDGRALLNPRAWYTLNEIPGT